MYLIYFDENKYSKENPFFYIGGVLLKDINIVEYEKTLMQIQYNFFNTNILNRDTEIHGVNLFHGKANFKQRSLKERVQLFKHICTFLETNNIPIRIVCIDVNAHRQKYQYPQPEYNLGLALMLERFCDFLDKEKDIGMVFGDHEKDEISKSIRDFSQFKQEGKTPMMLGRPLGRLIDTIYFTESHHSRFLQIADVIVYMAYRYEGQSIKPEKWHDLQIFDLWEKLKTGTNLKIQAWPPGRKNGVTIP